MSTLFSPSPASRASLRCALAAALALLPVASAAQTAPSRLPDKDVNALIEQVANNRGKFEDALSGDQKNAKLRGPNGETDVSDFLKDYKDNIDKLKDRFNDDYSAKLPGTGYIGEAAASGSADVGHDAVFPGLDSPVYRIATDSTNVYFIAGTTLYRRGLLGGGVTPIGTTPPASGIIQDLISDGTSLYFADNTGVYRIPVGGGATETLATGFSALRTLAADATFVYFTDQLGTSIMKLSK